MSVAINDVVAGEFTGQGTINVVFPSTQEITISDANDSIKIGDGSGNTADVDSGMLKVDGSGAIQPVSGPLTDIQLRASPVPISGTVTSTPSGTQNVDIVSSITLDVDTGFNQPLTDAQLRFADIDVDTGLLQPLTDAELRAAPVDVDTGLLQPLTDTQLRSTAVTVDTQLFQAVTDTQLRASPVPVSGTVTSTPSGTQDVDIVSSITLDVDTGLTQPLTDTELRASAVVVDGSGVIQPVSGTFWQATQPVSAASLPLPSGAATAANQSTEITALGTINTTLGSPFQAGGSIGNTTFASTQSGTWNIGTLSTVTNVVHVDDNSGSLTVDNGGTFAVQAAQSGTWNINNVSGTVSLPTGAATAALQTQPGVDIGDVTINNSTGASAVNIQDGGNSITVDGTVTAAPVTGALTDRSGTATNASTTLMAANGNRKFLIIQSTGANGIWINFTTAATAASPSILLSGQNATFTMEGSFVTTEAVTVIRNGNSNQTFSAKEG